MSKTSIQWSEHTWNPVVGCEAVSPGCAHCYAATMTRRLEMMGQADYMGLTTDKHFNGVVRCLPHKLDIPLKRRKPTTWFVNSMSDLFHENVTIEFQTDVFTVMAAANWHTYQILTKRAEQLYRLRQIGVGVAYRCGKESEPGFWPLKHAWIGVSGEDQTRINERHDWLSRTCAAITFWSLEPLLGPIDCNEAWRNSRMPDWVIVGGESGPGARPCRATWIRDIVRQCADAGVPCFVKQLGSNSEEGFGAHRQLLLKDKKGGDPEEWPVDLRVRQMPSIAAVEAAQ